MRIHRLRIASYRGVDEREVRFAPAGVTVVEGPNEVGKSSLAEALDLLLDHYDDTQKAAVRAVKPVHRDAGAEVEAELSAGPYRFTYTKRFHKDRATTLTVHEPAPASLTGRDAHDAVRTMLAETVDLTLWRAQRLAQGAAVELPDLREQTALARALDRAAAGLRAGEREDSLYGRVVDEYRRYHTPTGRPSARVKEAVAAHEAACHEAELVRKQLAEVEADVERCAALSRAVAACRRRLAEHEQRLPRLGAAHAELSRQAQDVERLRLASELAEADRAAAAADREAREQLAAQVRDAEQAVAELRAERERAAPAAVALDRAYAEAQAAVRTCSAELRTAREAAAAARQDYERARDRLDLELLSERAERVAEAQARAARAEEVLAGPTVDEECLAAVEDAQLALLAAEARLDGDHAVVEVEALGAAAVHVGDRTVSVDAPATVPVTAPVEVRVPGVAAVTVRPGGAVAGLAAARDEAAAHLADCLSAAGVVDADAARAAHRRREEAERQRADASAVLRRDLRDLTPELLADKVRRLRERVGDLPVPADLDPARQAADRAEALVASRAEHLSDAEQALDRAAAERDEARRAQSAAAARLAVAETTLADRRAALGEARGAVPDADLAARVAATAAAAEEAQSRHDEAARALDAADPGAARAALDNAHAAADRDAAELRRLEGDLRETRARLDVRGEEGLADRLAEAETRAARTGFDRDRLQARAAAARLLHQTMTDRRAEARRAYVAPFRGKITALARVVFGPGVSVELDEDLAITSRTLRGATVPFADLSAGAREQLGVIARLACAAITSDDGGVPLILDDALGSSDPARLEALAAVFALAARDAQVIVLTCVPDRYRHIGSASVVRLD